MKFPLELPAYSATSAEWSLTASTPTAPEGEIIAHMRCPDNDEHEPIADIYLHERRLILTWHSDVAKTVPLWKTGISMAVYVLPSRDNNAKLAWQNLLHALHGRGMRFDEENLRWSGDAWDTVELILKHEEEGAASEVLDPLYDEMAKQNADVADEMKEVVEHVLVMVDANAKVKEGPRRSGRVRKATNIEYGTNTADQGSGKKTKAPKAKLDWQNASPEHSLDQNAAMLMNLTRQAAMAAESSKDENAPEENSAIDEDAAVDEEDAAKEDDPLEEDDALSTARMEDQAKTAPRAGHPNLPNDVVDLTEDEVVDLTEEDVVDLTDDPTDESALPTQQGSINNVIEDTVMEDSGTQSASETGDGDLSDELKRWGAMFGGGYTTDDEAGEDVPASDQDPNDGVNGDVDMIGSGEQPTWGFGALDRM